MHPDKEYFQAIVDNAVCYFSKLGIQAVERAEDHHDSDCLYLEDITAFIQISGVVEGGLLVTVDDSLSLVLAHHYMLEEITDEEASQCAVEVIAEIANVITGNALTERPDRDIFLGTPLMIVTKRAEMRSKCNRLLVQPFTTEAGTFKCIYIPTENKSELASIFAGT
ncbi:chemotaxis protein CheX [Paenibacillus radicis (ex Xue et al. 2023)]|uniref:Chemotaxis protein CheX n=1 Tax=Paenibacillus radicis (ex Xue et al. 2023) TaxID=2972489 RepID=A0ABT1YLR2_9BACL|nr:chemotaxis protein CheX [Paenibacillus radicis (ex Xue et al. 2023)]MCR8634135.1 chemotaxis protein CheX [Paenibacillus radicis (ex Xue et al. 2023)]